MTDVLVFLVIIVPMAIAVGRFAVILFGGAVPGEHISWVEFKLLFWEEGFRFIQDDVLLTVVVAIDQIGAGIALLRIDPAEVIQ